MTCVRADEIYSTRPVMGDIWRHIQKADVIIADLTERNANVFYELGLCHAIWKRVVLLAQRIEDVPFDLRNFRIIIYEHNLEGAERLSHALARAVKLIREDVAEGIEITSPKDGETIFGEFAVEGKFETQPMGKDVRAFVASTRDKRIWPQGSVVFNVKYKTWSCAVNLWDQPRPAAYIFIAELGEDARILCDYYGLVGSVAQWVPLRQLTSDAIEYDRVRVINGFQSSSGGT